MFFAEPAAFLVAIDDRIVAYPMQKLKSLFGRYKTELAMLLILLLTVLAAFQLGRISVTHTEISDFRVIQTPH